MVIEFLLAVSCTSSRTASMAAKVDPIFARWNRPDTPGCGVGVSRDGAVIYERGYGMASLERRVPITSSTVFHLASITTLEFSPAEAGRPQAWQVVDGEGRRLVELQFMKFDIPKADLESFTGEYRSDELDVRYTVAIRDSSLIVQSSTLHPVFKDGFAGDYVGTVRFFRDPLSRALL